MSKTHRLGPIVAALALATAVALPAAAQNYDAMIQQSMARMNQIVGQAQNQVQQAVQQRMQDPAVQQAWHQYVQRMGGRPQMDYPTFTYYYIYTNGFSQQGMAHMQSTEGGIQRDQARAQADLRQAQAQRAAAQQAQRDGYSANQQEAGRALMGQSTYVAPNGQPFQLPHTWQPGTYRHQGQTYRVDAGGRYHVLGSNGWWYPLTPGR
jgi:hypothetical protein